MPALFDSLIANDFCTLNARERLQSNFISKTLTVLCLMEKVIAIFVKVLHSYDKRI